MTTTQDVIVISSNEIDCKAEMSEENSGDSVLEDEILEEVIKYVVAGSKGSQYKYRA